jgi:hypothetical protein
MIKLSSIREIGATGSPGGVTPLTSAIWQANVMVPWGGIIDSIESTLIAIFPLNTLDTPFPFQLNLLLKHCTLTSKAPKKRLSIFALNGRSCHDVEVTSSGTIYGIVSS